MKRWWMLPLVALAVGCSDDTALNTTDTTTLSEQNEEAAIVVGESIALESGGMLEAIEVSLVELDLPGGFEAVELDKDRLVDEAVFDSTTCTWTMTRTRSREGDNAGFNWTQTTTRHFMDGDGGCLARPDGDLLVQGLDFTRDYAGESWNPRSSGTRSGSGDWALRSLHDDEPGVRADGVHHREGAGETIRRHDGEPVVVEHAFTLDVDAHDLVIVQRRGRRVPVEGWMHVVYHAERGDHVVDRELTVTFGEDGGRIVFPGGETWTVDVVSGEIG